MKRILVSCILIFICMYSFTGCSKSTSSIPDAVQTVDTPVISPSSGEFSSIQYVTISCALSGSTIRYTTDGSKPSTTYGSIYYGTPITVKNTQTIRAIAYKSGYNNSGLSAEVITILSTIASPSFSVSGGTYSASQSVNISCVTEGVRIYYTTDGLTTPSETNGILYAGESIAVTLSQNGVPTVIQAIACKNGYAPSSVSSASYLITGNVAAPEFAALLLDPSATQYSDEYDVILTCITPNAVIKYTLDGMTPTRSYGTVYSGSIHVSSMSQIRAIAYVPNWSQSSDSPPVDKTYYVVKDKVLTPVITPTGLQKDGCFLGKVTISLNCQTSNSSIYYTINNTIDSSTRILYTGPFECTLSGNDPEQYTVRTYATSNGYTDSDINSATYTVTGSAANPVFSIDSDYYTEAQDITLSCTTDGAEIFYTLNGEDPSSPTATNVIKYDAPIHIGNSTGYAESFVIRAEARRTGWQTSSTIMKSYTITGHIPQVSISPTDAVSDHLKVVSLSVPGFSNVDMKILYTDDGSDPIRSNSSAKIYSAPFYVGSKNPHIIRARAYIPYWKESSDSVIAERIYTVNRTIYCSGTMTYNGKSLAYIWKNGNSILLPLPSGAQSTFANEICDDRSYLYVSGGYFDSSNISHAYAWRFNPTNNLAIGIIFNSPSGSDAGGSGISNVSYTSGQVSFSGYYTQKLISHYVYNPVTRVDDPVYAYFKLPCYWNASGSGVVPSNFVIDETIPYPSSSQAMCSAIGFTASGSLFYAGTYTRSSLSERAGTWRSYNLTSEPPLLNGEYASDIITPSSGGGICFGYEESASLARKAGFWINGSRSMIPLVDGVNGLADYAITKARCINGVYYCAGFRKVTSGKLTACYWNDAGTSLASFSLTDLSDGTIDTMTTDISAYTPYTYILGYKVQGTDQIPQLWINGTVQAISFPAGSFSVKGLIVR